jgi:outer membrane usher protein
MAELLYTPKQRTFAGLGANLGQYGNAQLAFGRQSYYDSETVSTVGLNYSIGLGTLGYLGFYASYSAADTSDTNLLLTWSMPVGDRRTLSASLQKSSAPSAYGGGVTGDVTFQRDLPVGPGIGYRASLSTDDRQDASLAYQGSAGIASIDYSRRDGNSGVRLGANGALAVTAAGVMPARQLNQSFAVVQVADYPGLTVFADNQPVGRTDKHGRVLIEALRPYQNNAISLDPTQVPMDGSLAQSEIGVTPAYRSGALVRFPVERALAATMRLMQADGTPVPAGATAQLGATSFPVVLDGLLYVEGLRDTAQLQVEWAGGQCVVEARRPAGNDPVPDLGDLRCR